MYTYLEMLLQLVYIFTLFKDIFNSFEAIFK